MLDLMRQTQQPSSKTKTKNHIGGYMSKTTKIPVHHYTEINSGMTLGTLKPNQYIKNEGGKQYLVEVWA